MQSRLRSAFRRTSAILILLLTLLTPPLLANRSTGGSAVAAEATETRADRADRLRKESRSRARRNLGYETISDPNEVAPHLPDYHALGALISRLGTIIQHYEASRVRAHGAGPEIPGLPSMTGHTKNAIGRTYGPEGPTVRSVRALLAYRLVTLGNPNLKVGVVKDADKFITATVVTQNESLVASYRIDKRDGTWHQSHSDRK